MMLDEVFRLIDQLTPEQRQQVKHYIDHEADTLRNNINAILQSAQSTKLQAGTMNMEKLLRATQGMWDGLNEDEINAIVQAMNEETIKPDSSTDE